MHPIVLRPGNVKSLESLADGLQRFFVEVERHAHRGRDGVTGDVVARGAETAGDDRDLASAKCLIDGIPNRLDLVADGDVVRDLGAEFDEGTREMGAVGVDDLSEDDLGSDRENLGARERVPAQRSARR
ncbi:MAG: hypothetical protein HYR85_00570 [Planctomycetes bacterium]|nr:hypothetical protein [Planctomycetota bacterium]